MKKICKLFGTVFLSIAALITIVGPASLSSVAVEQIPESMKQRR